MSANPYRRVKRVCVDGVKRHMDEHRWLVEMDIGRRLGRHELVHHRNGDKRDNRRENLVVVSAAEHAVHHGMWKHSPVKACVVCGTDFAPSPTKRRSAKTCGRECRSEFMSRINRDPSRPHSMYREGAYPSERLSRRSRRRSSKRTGKGGESA